jgi:hypothetical protein
MSIERIDPFDTSFVAEKKDTSTTDTVLIEMIKALDKLPSNKERARAVHMLGEKFGIKKNLPIFDGIH